MNSLEYNIEVTPPFRLDLTVWALRRRPANMIDLWVDDTWKRIIKIGDEPVLISVKQTGGIDAPVLHVTLFAEKLPEDAEEESKKILHRMLGLGVDLSGFYSTTFMDSDIGSLVKRFKGVRPPRFATFFETFLNAIIFQQISLHAATSVLNKFVLAFGKPFNHSGNILHAYPGPGEIVEVPMEDLRAVGLSGNKAKAISDTAARIRSGEFDPGKIEIMDNVSAWSLLLTLRGIGPWTADLILLRGYGRIDVFPRKDSGALAKLNRQLRGIQRNDPLARKSSLSPEIVEEAISRWQPYGGMVYFHLLLKGLYEEGTIQ